MRPPPSPDWRPTLFVAALVCASCVFTLGFACAVPLAAFGAIAALTLDWRRALSLALGVWLLNQVIGFTVLHYPLDAATLTWGAILAAIAALSALGPLLLVRRLETAGAGMLIVAPVSFIVAFAIYEGGLFAVSATIMGGTENYTAPIVARILALNAAAFAALVAIAALAKMQARPGALPPSSQALAPAKGEALRTRS